jgi:putative addiction module antidote
MVTRKLTKIGNSLGFTLPKDTLDRFNLREGDTVFVHETPAGIELTPYDPEFERQMEAAESILRRYRNAFRALAK